jgi:uncharacterized membrane protein (DUF485 family)
MVFNFTNITSGNSTLDILQTVNNEMFGGLFTILLVVALFFIIFINLSFYKASSAFMAASLFTTMITMFLYFSGLVPLMVFVISMVLTLIGILLALFIKA